MALGARDPDVEQAALLGDRLVALGLAHGQLALLDAGQEDGLELEPLRAVVGEQMHAFAVRRLRRSGSSSSAKKLGDRALPVVELACERDQAAEVVLAGRLVLAHALELLALRPAFLDRGAAHLVRTSLVDCEPASTWRSRRAAGRARNGPPRTWYGISASASASSQGSERALSRKRIATSS